MNKQELKKMIAKLSQFPHMERKENYQSYYLDGKEIKGSRDTLERMILMNIPKDLEGSSILDIGCNLGSICCECYKRSAGRIIGLDYEKDYIDCAIELNKYNDYDIDYYVKDLTKTKDCASFINSEFDTTIGTIFALSLYKHVKGKLFGLLDKLSFEVCIIESNNAPDGLQTQHVREIIQYIEKRNWKWKHIGTDNTRSPRMIFEVTK